MHLRAKHNRPAVETDLLRFNHISGGGWYIVDVSQTILLSHQKIYVVMMMIKPEERQWIFATAIARSPPQDTSKVVAWRLLRWCWECWIASEEISDGEVDDGDDYTNLCLEEQWHMEDCYIASPGRHCPGIAEPTPPDYEHHENQTINDLLDK